MNSQSYVSDELIHFSGAKLCIEQRYALFLKILGGRRFDPTKPREGWLQASYREEFGPGVTMRSDDREKLTTNEAIRHTMLCFCDIPHRPPEQLKIHMQKYGKGGPFGIAFFKKFLLHHGATPVYYVARNACNRAIGMGGPQNLGERFDELRAELRRVRIDLEAYVTRTDGAGTFLSKLSQPNTPFGHRLLGRFAALESEFEELVFARTKFFKEGLAEDDSENYYMEREWRLPDGLAFRLGNIARLILPRDYCEQFHVDVPEYTGEVCLVEPTLDSST